MATKLKPDRPVTRETACGDGERFLVVELHPRVMLIRPQGRHEAFAVDYNAVYDLARKLAAPRPAKRESIPPWNGVVL